MINGFSYFHAPITNIVPFSNFTLLDAFNYIKSDIAKETTTHLRSLSPESRKIFKHNAFDYCTFSGIFSSRRNKNLVQHSNLVCFDFDHLPDVEAAFKLLLDDKYFETQLLFRSPSGDGLKWVISMEKPFLCREQHYKENQADYQANFFRAVSYYMLNEYNLTTDDSGKDIARACFLPYDPEAYINPKAFL